MCTVVILRRGGHAWPLLLAANRDERLDRPWDPPGPWWPGDGAPAEGLVAGRDRLAGGTWMALGGDVVVAVLNRVGSLGPAAGRRSRGELPLLAAGAGNAAAGARCLAALDAGQWRPFNAVVADRDAAYFVRGLGAGRPECRALPDGLTMITAHDPDDLASPRVRRHLPRFRAAVPPEPDARDWRGWEALLADDGPDEAGDVAAALRVPTTDGFGTVCASLLALGAGGERRWRFAAGPAGTAPFHDVPLGVLSAAPPPQ